MKKISALAIALAVLAAPAAFVDAAYAPADAATYKKTTVCTTNPTTKTKYCRTYTSPVRR